VDSLDFVKLALQLATMLGCAVVFGEMMRRFRQPAVVGEMFGGIVLGPTIFGWLAPTLYEWLFLSSPNATVVRDASTKLGMLFFLFYAGLRVNLSDLKTVGRKAVCIGLIGTLLPIAAGVALVYAVPRVFWGPAVQEHFWSFALFIGMNLANSANPVIARILIDLGLLNGPIGALIMSATIVDDLVNWTLFAIILSDIAPSSPAASGGLIMSLTLVGLLFVVILGLGRWLGRAALRRLQPKVTWPTAFIAVTAVLVLLASSAAEALGVHAFLGAFLIGVAIGDASDGQKEAHDAIGHFVMSFAPIYFISMGMSAHFITNFDLPLVLVILVVACISKVAAVLVGAKAAGMPLDREAWAIGFALNARGATGIILAGVGLANGVIDARIFVAIVVMALITSLMAGPVMSRLLWHHQAQRIRRTPPAIGRRQDRT
jgi:Kef-type K+ transport system membrane component KefB